MLNRALFAVGELDLDLLGRVFLLAAARRLRRWFAWSRSRSRRAGLFRLWRLPVPFGVANSSYSSPYSAVRASQALPRYLLMNWSIRLLHSVVSTQPSAISSVFNSRPMSKGSA